MSTPSSTDISPSSSPVASNAPKFGTLVPNRIFVGGVPANTTEAELQTLFSTYGKVKATKIISDRAGVSKGYGFVTFETEEEAIRIQKEAGNIILKERKLNIAPAIKKQPFARVYDPVQTVANGTILYHNGVPYTYHNGVAFFTNSPENIYQYAQPQSAAAVAAAAYPVVYPHTVYVPQQQYPYQGASSPGLPTPPYMYLSQSASSPSTPNTSSSTPTSSSISTVSNAPSGQSNGGLPEFYTIFATGPHHQHSNHNNHHQQQHQHHPAHQHQTYSLVPSIAYAVAQQNASSNAASTMSPSHSERRTRNGTISEYPTADSPITLEGSMFSKSHQSNSSYNSPGGFRPALSYPDSPYTSVNQSLTSSPTLSYSSIMRLQSTTTPPNTLNFTAGSNSALSTVAPSMASSGLNGMKNSPLTFQSSVTSADILKSRTFQHIHGRQPHLVAKSVNGVTVMALPAPIMASSIHHDDSAARSSFNTPTMMNVSAKDHHHLVNDDRYHEMMLMTSSMSPSIPIAVSTPMTPPTTPIQTNAKKSSEIPILKGAEQQLIKLQSLSL